MFKIFSRLIPLKSFSKEEILNNYYIDLHKLLIISGHYKRVIYDKKGIPMFYYDFPLGIKYSPTVVALHALVHYQLRNFGMFMRYVEWLIKNADITEEYALLYFDFPFPPRAYSSRWMSGMTQGLAASVMARAFVYTNNNVYKSLTEKFAKGMLIPIQKGGPLLVLGDDLWIEEYPLERPPKHVLNGFIFALLGILDTYLITEDKLYHKFFVKGCLTLERNIKLYDLLLYSRYDAHVRSFASASYHLLNTIMVYIISKLINSYKLYKVAKRWFLGCMLLYPYLCKSSRIKTSRL